MSNLVALKGGVGGYINANIFTYHKWLLVDSLHGRLLIAATLVLAGFLGAAGVALHKAFRDSAEAALRDRLLGHVYALLAAANEDRDGRMLWPKALPDQRFSNPDSGLYALVAENDLGISWRSPSLTGQSGSFLRIQSPGESGWYAWHSGGKELWVLNFGIAWEDYHGRETLYTLAVAADIAPFLNEVQGFKAALWAWLGGLACILLIAQGVILQWGLKPLRTVAEDLRRIENGEAESLQGSYPKELRGLTNNLNALIGNARAKQQRYRNSLDDLAHSLKTPLAILRNAAQDNDEIHIFKTTVQEHTIDKWAIFYYIYGLLHHPGYREKYAANLKRELPRIPYAENFWPISRSGQQLADLHLNYETQPEYQLTTVVTGQFDWRVEKMRLTKDKTAIIYSPTLTLGNIPAEVFEYRLGNRSVLDWIIDQYQVSTDKRSGIVNDPNRLDDERYIVRLIQQIVTVSLETVRMVSEINREKF